MNKKLFKIVLQILVGVSFSMMAHHAMAKDIHRASSEDGFITQVKGQIQNGSFVVTNFESKKAFLQVTSTHLTVGPKILLTFRFGSSS